MKVRQEINLYSDTENAPVLTWLLDRYSWSSQWQFVAKCEHVSVGKASYQSIRKWKPTEEGLALYKYAQLTNEL